jgi:hypothetical protein
MYRALCENSEKHIVIWKEGGFASCSLDLKDGEERIKKRLNIKQWFRLILQHLRQPQYILAKKQFDKVLPDSTFGYILTIGTGRAIPGGSGPSGSSLLAEIERQILARGAFEVWVDTEVSNLRAIEFYKKHGYIVKLTSWGNVLLRKAIHAENQ